MHRFRAHRVARGAALYAAMCAAVAAAPAVVATGSAEASSPTSVAVSQNNVAGGARHPLRLAVRGWTADAQPLVTSTVATGYTPAQLRGILGLTGTGTGQTIAIVTAYDAPNALADLGVFDKTFGLPAPPSFKKVSQTGGTKFPPVDGSWALETALDVQWAHAVAPGAGILLVEASSSSLNNLLTALTYAAGQPGVTVISNSYGTTEYSLENDQNYRCKLTTAVCVFASGDNGNPGLYPATNPYALAVGGTTLRLDSANAITSEVAWSGSGGGVSPFVAKPAYQSSLTAAKRVSPDVSYNGDPATGVAVYSSTTYQQQSGWFQMGGTSAGAPQWAGIIAAGNQLRKAAGKPVLAGYNATTGAPLHNALYPSGRLADITSGTNGSCGTSCTAATGYDAVTGLGSPRTGLDLVLRDAA